MTAQREIFIRRRPSGALAAAVAEICLVDRRGGDFSEGRERSLPSGGVHVVFRLSGRKLRIYDDADELGRTVAAAVVGGPRTSFVRKAVDEPSYNVCAMLRPGAASLLFGDRISDFAARHVDLADVWGSQVGAAFERVAEARSNELKLSIFEEFLASRMAPDARPSPLVAAALARHGATVAEIVAQSGYSHRYLADVFRRHVGLTPKAFAQVRRMSESLAAVASGGEPLVEVALRAGFSDQAHFTREFRRFAGVTPTEYRAARPAHTHHLPDVRKNFDKR